MCGIVGSFGRKQVLVKETKQINKMLASIKYRGPDGNKIIKEKNFITGCARLAIVDPLKRSSIPFETNRFILSYNGELYNYKVLRKILKKDFKFNTKSDTEVFIKAFEKWGIDCFKRFNGMYACCIYDKIEKKAYLIRDSFGIKPLFYLQHENKIFFSSEIKAFKKITKLYLDIKNIKQWFHGGTVDGDETLIKNVKKVEEGSLVIFDRNLKKKKVQFFKLENTFKGTGKINLNKLEKELNYQTKIHMVDKASKSAILLSGGLDSSLLAAIIKKKYNNRSKNFYSLSCRVNFPGLNEKQDQKEVLSQIKIKNFFINLNSKNFFKNFHDCTKKLDHPCFHPGLVGLDMVIKSIKIKNLKVMYVGDGADEIFIGYDWFTSTSSDANLKQLLDGVSYNSFKLIEPAFKTNVTNVNIKNLNKTLIGLNVEEKLRYINQKIYLSKWLYSRDIIGMRHSIEIRVPYCNTKFLELVNPTKSKFLKDKILLKTITKKYLKKSNFNRKKPGFTIPIRSWLTKKILNKFLEKIDLKNIRYYNYSYINKILNEHYSGKKNHIRFIWTLISFELWKKSFFNQKIN